MPDPVPLVERRRKARTRTLQATLGLALLLWALAGFDLDQTLVIETDDSRPSLRDGLMRLHPENPVEARAGSAIYAGLLLAVLGPLTWAGWAWARAALLLHLLLVPLAWFGQQLLPLPEKVLWMGRALTVVQGTTSLGVCGFWAIVLCVHVHALRIGAFERAPEPITEVFE